MNGEIPSVPVTTLSGVTSLTDLLSEIPLPAPLPHTTQNQSLLYHPYFLENAGSLLHSSDSVLVSQILQAVQHADSENIVLKDGLESDNLEGDVPELLKQILSKCPALLKKPKSVESTRSSGRKVANEERRASQKLSHQKASVSGGLPYESNKVPVVNGGSPSTSQSSHYPSHGSRRSSRSIVSSPAQGSAAPVSQHPADHRTGQTTVNVARQKGDKGMELDMFPTLKLTRLEQLVPNTASSKKRVNKESPFVMVRTEDGEAKFMRNQNYDQNDKRSDRRGGGGGSMSDRVKRKRRQAASYAEVESDSDQSVCEMQPSAQRAKYDSSDDEQPSHRKRKSRRERQRQTMNTEELLESNVFKRFCTILDGILDDAGDANIDVHSGDEDEYQEPIITRSALSDLCNEAAKLKSLGVTNQIPKKKLIRVLTLLQWNIKDGCRAIPLINQNDCNDHDSFRREIAVERVIIAVDAALTALYILTAPDMPKQVYIEDVIERLVMMVKTQLQSTIYPEFDPVYRIDNKHPVQSGMKAKRARSTGAKDKTVLMLYNKLSEVVGTLAQLVDVQELTDTIILQASTLAVTPFFVENINELQLNALKLVTSIFTRYEKHRQLIMEDILSSLARLPSSKKNLRSYRLNSEDNIQMVTALALELIQCVVKLPKPKPDEGEQDEQSDELKVDTQDAEMMILTSYDTSMRTAHRFLSVFLQKCATKGEEDYRPLFENFVYDLLAAVNIPEWPAAELLLSLLGRLLVQQFSNKSVDMSMRVTSLDYLGIVAARLRKDAISSRLNEDVIQDIISTIHESDSEEVDKGDSTTSNPLKNEELEKTSRLQKALLQYLVYYSQNDPALVFSRQFYIAQWYKDCKMEVEKARKKKTPSKKPQRHQKRRGRRKVETSSEEESEEDDEDEMRDSGDKLAGELEELKQVQAMVEGRKEFLMQQINTKLPAFTKYKPSPSKLDYENACLVTRYLAANRPFSQSFDIYLTQILKVLCETAVAVRTKAMKCLISVVEADPGILARNDMKQGVHARLLDSATSVREASVDLLGKFILIRPELTAQYYDMLSNRILDTGISVRKRVIKIFRDICIEQPEFDKIPEMCVRMIRRVNDEEGIKKLVNETFQTMWFTPVSSRDESKLLRKVMNIIDVVAAFKDTGQEWFEHLLDNLLKKEAKASYQPCEKACEQIINCLVENVLMIEEIQAGGDLQLETNQRLSACFATLLLFCKVSPQFLVAHIQTIQPYLNIRCSSPSDFRLLYNVAQILEQSVPLMDHPGEGFMALLEEDMVKLVLKHGVLVVGSCISCLGALVNNVTHNYTLVWDCFMRFFNALVKMQTAYKENPHIAAQRIQKGNLNRALYCVGLLCKHFDFDDTEAFIKSNKTMKDRVFDVLTFFLSHEDEDVRVKALGGIGHFCVRHYDFMLSDNLKALYHHLLSAPGMSVKMKCQVLRNIQIYLVEEEKRMTEADAEWNKAHDKEDIKELGDVQSGMASTMIQLYMKQVLESFFHMHQSVRTETLVVVCLILNQGLVHPVLCVPYLVCMGTDCDPQIRSKADQQLKEIDKKYPGFIQMKAMAGIRMSYRLQEILQMNNVGEPVRGMRMDQTPIALNHYIYSLIRSNRNYRRAVLSNSLNMFDDTAKTPLTQLLYMADNLAYFPYQHQDEPLYIIHQVDILVSVSGANLLQSFHELFYPDKTSQGRKLDDDEDEEVHVLMDTLGLIAERTPANIRQVQELYMMSQGCVLLLNLKQYLKEAYGFTDAKISRYTPTEQAKVYDKPLNRRPNAKFNPKQVLDVIKNGEPSEHLSTRGKTSLILAYLDFKALMLSIDPDDDDDDDGESRPRATHRQFELPSVGYLETHPLPDSPPPPTPPPAPSTLPPTTTIASTIPVPQLLLPQPPVIPVSTIEPHNCHVVEPPAAVAMTQPPPTTSSASASTSDVLHHHYDHHRHHANSDINSAATNHIGETASMDQQHSMTEPKPANNSNRGSSGDVVVNSNATVISNGPIAMSGGLMLEGSSPATTSASNTPAPSTPVACHGESGESRSPITLKLSLGAHKQNWSSSKKKNHHHKSKHKHKHKKKKKKRHHSNSEEEESDDSVGSDPDWA